MVPGRSLLVCVAGQGTEVGGLGEVWPQVWRGLLGGLGLLARPGVGGGGLLGEAGGGWDLLGEAGWGETPGAQGLLGSRLLSRLRPTGS